MPSFKHILVVSNRLPCNGGKGDQVVGYNRIKYLIDSGLKVSLCSFEPRKWSKKDVEDYNQLKSIGVEVYLVKYSIREAIVGLLRCLLNSQKPFQCGLFDSDRFRSTVNAIMSGRDNMIVHCITLRSFVNINIFGAEIYVDLIDSEGLKLSRRAKLTTKWLRWLVLAEKDRCEKYERYVAERSKISFVVSQIDRRYIGLNTVVVIPLGVDVRIDYSPKKCNANNLLFTGNMGYHANVDAVRWFVEKCWLNILKIVPTAEFWIVGSSPSISVLKLADDYPAVHVTGWVAELDKFFAIGSIAIAPMQSGSGMQFKILEAMANGVPVLATTIGMGDIRVTDRREILIADSVEDFVARAVEMLRDSDMRDRVGFAGYSYVLKNHAWKSVNSRFMSYIDSDHCRIS